MFAELVWTRPSAFSASWRECIRGTDFEEEASSFRLVAFFKRLSLTVIEVEACGASWNRRGTEFSCE
jgi:hypothetical protein